MAFPQQLLRLAAVEQQPFARQQRVSIVICHDFVSLQFPRTRQDRPQVCRWNSTRRGLFRRHDEKIVPTGRDASLDAKQIAEGAAAGAAGRAPEVWKDRVCNCRLRATDR